MNHASPGLLHQDQSLLDPRGVVRTRHPAYGIDHRFYRMGRDAALFQNPLGTTGKEMESPAGSYEIEGFGGGASSAAAWILPAVSMSHCTVPVASAYQSWAPVSSPGTDIHRLAQSARRHYTREMCDR